jgi:hypothetical protein
MPLGRRRDPFDHPEWIFELKHDGFRACRWRAAPRPEEFQEQLGSILRDPARARTRLDLGDVRGALLFQVCGWVRDSCRSGCRVRRIEPRVA